MNRREELQEHYEDALFALLMSEIAEKEGELAWEENERLKNDPSAAVPEDVDRRCLQTIRRHCAKQKVRKAGRVTAKAVKYILLAAGLASLTFTVAFAASETVRVNTMNLMIEVFEQNTVFEIEKNSTNPAAEFSVGWLPDGYVLKDQGCDSTMVWFQYQRADDELIWTKYTLSDGTSISVDTEDAETEYIEINGIKAMLIHKEYNGHNGNKEYKDDVFQLIWTTEDKAAFIQVIGEGASQKDVLHVARELNY